MKISKDQKEKLVQLLRQTQDDILMLQDIIGVKFKNPLLLMQACIHASFANEQGLNIDNEKLEFLGDAVLSLVISEYLYKTTVNSTEGDLAKTKSIIASETALAELAQQLGLDEFLLLGKGASKEERGKKSNLADFVEAIIGAIFLDKGLKAVKNFIYKNLLTNYSQIDFAKYDPKSTLQEYMVKKYHSLPKYRVISISGPAHARNFVCAALYKDRIIGIGEGRSKKEAEKKAALSALTNLGYRNSEKPKGISQESKTTGRSKGNK